MELDDLKQAWAARFAAHDDRLAGLERRLVATASRRAGAALLPSAVGKAIEAILIGGALAAIAPRVVAGLANARYLVAGVIAVLFLAAWCATSTALAVRLLRLDLARPVVAIQRDLARLQRGECLAVFGLLAAGLVAWLPCALLLFEAATGVPALARVDLAWLAANVALGGVVFVLAVAWARRFAGDPLRRPRLDRFAAALSGRGLRRARAALDEVEALAREA